MLQRPRLPVGQSGFRDNENVESVVNQGNGDKIEPMLN